MENTPLSPNGVAEALVARRKAQLEAAYTEARESRSLDDWLADRQDLLHLEHFIRDRPRRVLNLSHAQATHARACSQLHAQRSKDCPFQAPVELAGRLDRQRWLAGKLVGATDSHLGSLLGDLRLDEADRSIITARIQANTRWVPIYILVSAPIRREGVVGGSDDEWAQYVRSVNETLRHLEGELEAQKRVYDNRLRSDVEGEFSPLTEVIEAAQAALSQSEMALTRQREIDDYVACRIAAFVHAQQREWWAAVATHPIASVVEQLPSVPAEQVATVMGRLLALPTADPYVHHEDVRRFVFEHRRFVGGLSASAPVIVAFVGRLVAAGDDKTACALLDLSPAGGDSPLAGVADYLRFVLRKGPDLSDVTFFKSLTANDLFLGARYCKGDATATLQRQSQWEALSLEQTLMKDGGTKYLNQFRVSGLQPRIAELAFREIVGRLRGTDAVQGLRDLNDEVATRVASPRTLGSLPPLPSDDWKDESDRGYDVKCNLFYPKPKEGRTAGLPHRFEAALGLALLLSGIRDHPKNRRVLSVGLRWGVPAGHRAEAPSQGPRPFVLLPPSGRGAVRPTEREKRPRRRNATPERPLPSPRLATGGRTNRYPTAERKHDRRVNPG